LYMLAEGTQVMHAKLEHKSDNGLFQSIIVTQNSFPARM